MQEKIIWFIGGYVYCLLINYIINYKRKKVKKMWVMISIISILLYILFTILEGYEKYKKVGEE